MQTSIPDSADVLAALSVPLYICRERHGAVTVVWDADATRP